jgi:GR25 family glycosyltransferase involved in LPS biosynthesis
MLTYVINLANAKERWNQVLMEFNTYNIVPKRIEAINIEQSLSSPDVTPKCKQQCPRLYAPITLSHLLAWKTALRDLENSNDQGVLICEDDVRFEPNAFSNFDLYIEQVPKDFDVVYFGCLFCQKKVSLVSDIVLRIMGYRKQSKQISENVWVPPYTLGAHCYYVSRKGLYTLIELYTRNIYTCIDIMLNDFAKQGKIKSYSFQPLLAYQSCSFTASGQFAKTRPQIVNTFFDKIMIDEDVTLAYGLNFPISRIGDYEITGFHILYVLQGLFYGCFGWSAYWFYMFLSIEIIASGNINFQDFIIRIFLFLTSYAIGLKLRSAVIYKKLKSTK